MRIALYGIGGTYNYGCDAIVKGTEKIIHKKYPEAIIDYYSYSAFDDKIRLHGIKIKIIPVYSSRIKQILCRVIGKAESILRGFSLIQNDWMTNTLLFRWVNKYDYVLSIGGDIYTLPPVAERNDISTYTNRLLEFDKYCAKKHVKNIVWGASIGPFEECPQLKEIFLNHIKTHIYRICVREKHSYDYLMKNQISNILLVADPAFVLSSLDKKPNNKNIIAINLSPLSSLYANDARKMNQIVQNQAKSIMAIQDHFNCKILLIPHVYSAFKEDDDFEYLKNIYDLISQEKKIKNVELITSDSFLDTKKWLLQSDLCIAARMHCAMNAISSGIPTIFLAYSEKAKGMCEMVYGTEDYAIDIHQFENQNAMIELIGEIIRNQGMIANKVTSSKSRLCEMAYASVRALE